MSASIVKRGRGRYAVVVATRQHAQRCDACIRTVRRGGREVAMREVHWLRDGERPLANCRRCGAALPPPQVERRQRWERKGSYEDAKLARADRVTQKAKGEYVEPTDLTLGSYLEERWLPAIAADVKPTTYESYSANVRTHLVPGLGEVKIQHLTREHVKALYARLLAGGRRGGGGLSPKSIRNVHVVLRKALNDAVDSHLLLRNVAAGRGIAPKSAGARDMKVWAAEEVTAFLNHVRNDRLFACYRLLCSTGMRRGEALGVRWRDLDLDAARLSVTGALVRVTYKRVERSTPKSDRGRRVVDLDASTVAALRSHRARQLEERIALKLGKPGPDALVFTELDGGPLHPDAFSDAFAAHIREAGIAPIRLHDVRHTWATLAIKAGVNVKVVSERLGHFDPAFTLSVYQHVVPGMQREAAERVAALIDV